MSQIPLEIRQRLYARRPSLSLAQADSMIADIGECYFGILADNQVHGKSEWQDFSNFTCLDGVYLSTIYRKEEIEIGIFEADDSLILESNPLSMIEVEAFWALVKSKAKGEISVLRFSMRDALPWMTEQKHEKA